MTYFGLSVTLSPNGKNLVVGATGHGDNRGTVYLFRNEGARTYSTRIAHGIDNLMLDKFDHFGSSAALFADDESRMFGNCRCPV